MFNGRKPDARLGPWNGRRLATRCGEPVLARLRQRPVLLRLGVVLLTVLVVTVLVFAWGPPFPYRVGAVYPQDLRVRVHFELINQPQTERLREEAVNLSGTDPAEREAVRLSVPPVVDQYPEGMPLVPRGQPVTDKQLFLLEEEHRAYVDSLTLGEHIQRGVAIFLIVSLLVTLVVFYVLGFQAGLARSLPKIVGVCALVILSLWLALVLSKAPWHALLIPLTVSAMILTIAYNPPFALLMSFSLALVVNLSLGTDLNHLLVMMGGLATAVLLLRNIRSRTRLVEVAAAAGLAYLAMTISTGLLSQQTWALMASDGGRRFLWALLAGFILNGSLPLIERLFGIVTDISLQELADGSHPLLQELVRRAPGTYTHSITVATLAEAAAESIGANPLLARVGSYFHDIGKMLKPQYFIENQTGTNRHDSLEPALSTLVIIGHVKDGIALAQQYRLPRPIIDCIQQHHGTTLVQYFYREAVRLHEDSGQAPPNLELSFRYPGPKPQSRETGILMLADAVESSSRALAKPSPSSLRKLVHDLLMKRLLDGQFEESGLTLTELYRIEESLCKSVIALYHARISYEEENEREAS
jgi:hypothetical protein